MEKLTAGLMAAQFQVTQRELISVVVRHSTARVWKKKYLTTIPLLIKHLKYWEV
jgi:hypothetical protein